MPLTTDGHTFAVDAAAAGSILQAWSLTRLPYEPKGVMEHLRDALRRGIRQIDATEDGVVHALYGSAVREDCDAENVAIYNVAGGNFANIARSGLRVERSLTCPPAPALLDGEPKHYVRYRAVGASDPLHVWMLGDRVASWSDVPMPRLNEDTKPATVWAPMRGGDLQRHRELKVGEPFGLVLRVGVPVGERAAPAKLVKPLADGVIAALHVYGSSSLADIVSRVHAQVPALSEEEIRRLLTQNAAGVLGARNFVWPRANGLQWSPADHLCWALVVDVRVADRWSVSGEATFLHAAETGQAYRSSAA